MFIGFSERPLARLSGIFLALFLFILGAGACSPSRTTSSSVEYGTADHSCDFTPDQGGVVSPPVLIQLDTTYFEKVFDRASLEAVYPASIRQTAQFIGDNLGVELDQATSPPRHQCSPMGFLPKAGNDSMKIWNSAASGAQGEDSYLVGLYLSKDMLPTQKAGTILIAPDAVKWSLVHEMTHHLFEIYRDSQIGTPTSAQLDQQLRESIVKMQSCTTNGNCAQPDQAAILAQTADLTDQKLVRFTLEEIAVEANLSKAFHAKQLLYVSDESRNSMDYIAASAASATALYIKLADTVDQELNTVGGSSPDLVSISARLHSRLNEIQQVYQEIEAIDGPPGAGTSGSLESAVMGVPENPGFICHHADEDQKTALEINQIVQIMRSARGRGRGLGGRG